MCPIPSAVPAAPAATPLCATTAAAAPLPYIASLLAEQSGRDENPKPTKTSLFSHRKRLVRQRLQDFCHENKEILVTTTRAPQDVNDIIKKIRRVAAPQGHGLVR